MGADEIFLIKILVCVIICGSHAWRPHKLAFAYQTGKCSANQCGATSCKIRKINFKTLNMETSKQNIICVAALFCFQF